MCDWLEGLGAAAQARVDGTWDAAPLARRALEARPRGGAAARARLELGLSLGSAEHPADKVAALRGSLAAVPPLARDAVLSALGEALLAAGEPHAAAQSFRTAAMEGAGEVARRARRRAASALHVAGLAVEAAAAWKPLAGDHLASELEPAERVAFAVDLRGAGEPARAAEILRSIWLELPERPEAPGAEATLSAWRDAGDRVPPFTGEERVARAFRLVALGRATDGRLELDLASRAAPPAPPELLAFAEATALLALGRAAEAARGAEPLAQARDAGIRRGAAVVLARAAARERRFADAIAAWRSVAASRAVVPGLPPAAQASLTDDAEYFAAWLSFDAGELDRAAADLSRLARERPRSRRADDARWFAAWALIRKGAHPEAEAALRLAERGPAIPRVRYWRARISGDPAEAASLLASIASSEPLGYYGLLACARLRASGASCPAVALPPGTPPATLPDLAEPSGLRRAALLASLGLRDDAVAELTALAASRGGRRAAPLAAELALFIGDPLLPFLVARDQTGLSRRTLAWSFPEAWPRLVGGAAAASRIDPALLRAVMRRESGFRTDARSPAGAVGLLQVIPNTASRLASLLGLPPPLAERLDDASVNVPLGAGYLSLLLERFGEPLLAIAAYNAGPNAVLRWSRDRASMPLDVWVESIPYRETRQYVRAVVENWAGARMATGEPPPELDPARLVPAPAGGVAF